jgi:dihydrofolate reductase
MPSRQESRSVVLQMGVSLDGFVAGQPDASGLSTPVFARSAQQAPDVDGGWGLPPEDPELTQRKLAWLRDTGTHIMGRVTYEQMATFWPTATDDYAAPMNEIPKVVFSQTLERADWPDSRIARGNLADEIARLKREPGGDIIAWGGARFAQSLARLGLVDEYRIVIHPIALGNGLPLFTNLAAPLRLKLIDASTYEGGTAVHVYQPL